MKITIIRSGTCNFHMFGGVPADPFHTLLLKDLPAPKLRLVQAVDTNSTILLKAAWALAAGFEPVTLFG